MTRKKFLIALTIISLQLTAIFPASGADPISEEILTSDCDEARNKAENKAYSLIRKGVEFVIYGHALAQHIWVVSYAIFEPGTSKITEMRQYNYDYQDPNNCNDGDRGAENVSFSWGPNTRTWEKKHNVKDATTDSSSIPSWVSATIRIFVIVGFLIVVGTVLYVALSSGAGPSGGGNSCFLDNLLANTAKMILCGG